MVMRSRLGMYLVLLVPDNALCLSLKLVQLRIVGRDAIVLVKIDGAVRNGTKARQRHTVPGMVWEEFFPLPDRSTEEPSDANS